MQFLLNPLIINFFYLSVLWVLLYITFRLIGSFMYKSANIYEYKINNKFISLIGITLYIAIVIILLYILRVYNIPKEIDLKNVQKYFKVIKECFLTFFGIYSYFTQIYIIMFLLLLVSICCLLIIRAHKRMYKEIYKFFLFYIAGKNSIAEQDKLVPFIINKLSYLYGFTDIIHYTFYKISHFFTKRQYGENYKYYELPAYNSTKIIYETMSKSYYKKLMQISPMFFVFYDCIYNDFILTHVFYYLLFFVPIRLLKRICNTIGSHSRCINNLLQEMYYAEENCIYAVSLNLHLILKNYILSGVEMNVDLGIDNARYISQVIRFIPCQSDIYPSIPGVYVNFENQFLHTDDNIHFFHIIEDEDGNPTHGGEWIVLANKLNK